MDGKIHVGIDYGDLGLKVVYVVDSKLSVLPLPPETSRSLIFFDPNAKTSSLGVGFPSVLQKIGTRIPFRLENLFDREDQRTETPESLVSQALSSARKELLEVTGKPIRSTVIAVPSSLGQNGRRALLDCAKASGFEEITLIDTCTAAALGFHGNSDKSITAVVFDLSYGDCEYSLLRLLKERCRVVAAGTVPGVSGEMLNSLMMEATVLALRKKRIFLGLKQFTSPQWMIFRRLAEEMRHALATHADAETILLPQLTGSSDPIRIRYNATALAAKISPLIGNTIDSIQGVLEQNALDISDIEVFLVVGDAAQASPVLDILSHVFAGRLRRTDPNLVAVGAAFQAIQSSQSAGGLVSVLFNNLFPPVAADAPTPGPRPIGPQTDLKGVSEVAEVIERGLLDAEQLAGSRGEPNLDAARKLIEAGNRQEAAVILEAIDQEVRSLKLKMLEAESLSLPRVLIQQAQAMINTGNFLSAVSLAHQAYEQAPNDLQVFAGMMRIHADASLALNRPEEYDSAIHILKCAHSHDQTDRLIHKALAERHYIHAVTMRGLNNLSNALAMVELAVSFDPKHEGANQLLEELTNELAASQPQQDADAN